MSQQAPSFVLSCIATPKNNSAAKALVLNSSQAAKLQSALEEDARGAIYSGIVSIADAFSGIQRGYFSWAVVKLYYSCFYFSKAALARRGIGVFYVGRSPFLIEAQPGSSPTSQPGNSHTVVTALYKKRIVGGAMNSQPIDGIHAFDWMTEKREAVNYKDIRFSDPVVPACFATIDSLGIRRVVGDYLGDRTLYAYDAAHAIVALPLAALVDEFSSAMRFGGLGLSNVEVSQLRSFLADQKGPIHHFSFLSVK